MDRTVSIPVGHIELEGSLEVPTSARGIVVFAHGSGSSRFSSRNRRVASVIQGGGLGTLLIDLLSAREAEGLVKQAGELAERATAVVERALSG